MSERPRRKRNAPARYRPALAPADASTPASDRPPSRADRRRVRRKFASLPADEQRRRINSGKVRFRNTRFSGSNYTNLAANTCTVRGNNNTVRGDENHIYGNGNIVHGDNNFLYGENNRAYGANNTLLNADGTPYEPPAARREPPVAPDERLDGLTGEPDLDAFLANAPTFRDSVWAHQIVTDANRARLFTDIAAASENQLARTFPPSFAANHSPPPPATAQPVGPMPVAAQPAGPMPVAGAAPHTSKWKACVLDLEGEPQNTTVSELQCVICYDHKRDTIYEPCGHTSVCRKCTRALYNPDKSDPTPKCPECRAPIEFSRIVF